MTDAETDRLAEALPDTGAADVRYQASEARTVRGTAGSGPADLSRRAAAGFALRHWHGGRLDSWHTADLADPRTGTRRSERAGGAPRLPTGDLRHPAARSGPDWTAVVDAFDEARLRAGRAAGCHRQWVLRADRWASTLANTAGARIGIAGAAVSVEVRAAAGGRSAVRFGRCTDPAAAVELLGRLDDAAVRAVTAGAARTRPDGLDAPAAIVADPAFAALLAHELVGHPLEADVPSAPGHWTRAAEPVGGRSLTVVDDPAALGLGPVDHEGVPSRRVRLLDRGRVSGRLHSLATARDEGAEPTGHARAASWHDPPIPRMTATGFTGGSGPLAALVDRCGDGLLLYGARGGRCGADGTFTAVSQGSRQITGSRLGPERGPVLLRGATRPLLAAVLAVSEDAGLDAGGEGGCGKADQDPVETAGIGGGVLFGPVIRPLPLWR